MATRKGPDRREHARHVACSVTLLDEHYDNEVGLIRNVSTSGALLLTRRRLEVGEDLDMTIHVTAEDTIPAHAKVVRSERIEAERAGLWRYETGVTFTEGLAEHAGALQELNETANR